MYTYSHTGRCDIYTCKHIRAYTYTHIHTYAHVHSHTYTHTHTHTHTHTGEHVLRDADGAEVGTIVVGSVEVLKDKDGKV